MHRTSTKNHGGVKVNPSALWLAHGFGHVGPTQPYEKRIFKQRALANLNRVKGYEGIQKDATERDYPVRAYPLGEVRVGQEEPHYKPAFVYEIPVFAL